MNNSYIITGRISVLIGGGYSSVMVNMVQIADGEKSAITQVVDLIRGRVGPFSWIHGPWCALAGDAANDEQLPLF